MYRVKAGDRTRICDRLITNQPTILDTRAFQPLRGILTPKLNPKSQLYLGFTETILIIGLDHWSES